MVKHDEIIRMLQNVNTDGKSLRLRQNVHWQNNQSQESKKIGTDNRSDMLLLQQMKQTEKREKFYQILQDQIKNPPRHDILIVMGGKYAKAGTKNERQKLHGSTRHGKKKE